MAGDSLPKYLTCKWEEIKSDNRACRYNEKTKTPLLSKQPSSAMSSSQKQTIPSLNDNESHVEM